jgi:hypothetical protein
LDNEKTILREDACLPYRMLGSCTLLYGLVTSSNEICTSCMRGSVCRRSCFPRSRRSGCFPSGMCSLPSSTQHNPVNATDTFAKNFSTGIPFTTLVSCDSTLQRSGTCPSLPSLLLLILQKLVWISVLSGV